MQQQSLSNSNPQAYRLMGEVLLFFNFNNKRKAKRLAGSDLTEEEKMMSVDFVLSPIVRLS